MTHEDYLACAALKVFTKEKEYYLQHGLHAHVPGILAGYYLKIFNPTTQSFKPQEPQKQKNLKIRHATTAVR